MVIVGPNIITHGLDPATAIIGSGDMGYLGPAVGPSTEVDPISRFFVLLGKLISVRRVLSPTDPGVVDFSPHPEHPVGQFGALSEALLGFAGDAEFDVVWRPLTLDLRDDALGSMRRQADDLDQRTRRFVAAETQVILAIDPNASVEERMASVDAYLRNNGFTVEQASGGFRDFIAHAFNDAEGNAIRLPTSTNPSFPDAWITPIPVDPAAHGGSRREWNILW